MTGLTDNSNEQGEITDVRLVTMGGLLAAPAAIGATTLFLEDAGDFNEDGGVAVISYLDPAGSPGTGPDGLPLPVPVIGEEVTYSAADLDADTLTLATATSVAHVEGEWVAVSPSQTEKQAVVILADADDTVTVRVPHNFSDLLVDGIRDEDSREQVLITLDDGEWVIRDVLGKDPAIRSVGYTEGVSGWALSASETQFEDASVLGTLGASSITAEEITLGTQDLGNDILGPLPGGVVAFANIATGTATASIAATETILFEFNAGNLIPSHVYYILVHGHLQGTVGGDGFDFYLRWTGDDTTPALTSGIIDGSVTRVNLPGSGAGTVSTAFSMHGIYFLPNTTPTPLRLALSMKRAVGTGTAFVYMNSADRSLQFWIFDMGLRDDLPGSYIQRSGGTATGTPTATYTKTWTAVDSFSFANTGDVSINDDGTYATQGYFSAYEGTQKSVVLFDDVAIRAALVGATIKSVKATFRVRHARQTAGLDVGIRDHNFPGASNPSTYPGGTAIASRADCKEGATYTVELGADHGVAFGNALKNGTAKGYGFYAVSADPRYVGGMYGGVSASPPKLTITYTK